MVAAVACLDEVCEAIDRIAGRELRMVAMRSAGCSRVAVRRENAIATVKGVEGVRSEKVVGEEVSNLHWRDGGSFVFSTGRTCLIGGEATLDFPTLRLY